MLIAICDSCRRRRRCRCRRRRRRRRRCCVGRIVLCERIVTTSVCTSTIKVRRRLFVRSVSSACAGRRSTAFVEAFFVFV